jgi:CRP/FNR family cyclic AMP-dependent transcriptional regulator
MRVRGEDLVSTRALMDTPAMREERAAELLGATQLFGGLDREALKHLAARVMERSYKKGQLIFYQGDPGDALFVVVEGLVKVFVPSEEGDEMVLITLEAPEVFGEVALIDGGPRSASAEALEPTAVLMLTREVLLEVLAEHPSLTDRLLQTLGTSLRRLTEQAADLVFLDLHGRMAKLLVGMAEDRGTKEGPEVVLDLHMTQTDLAGMVGGSRQSVNQILRSFERRGYLELRGRQIRLKQPELLRRRAHL